MLFELVTLHEFPSENGAAIPNTDFTRAPFIALLEMALGASIKRHYRQHEIAAVYVVKVTLTKDGHLLEAGTFTIHGPGT